MVWLKVPVLVARITDGCRARCQLLISGRIHSSVHWVSHHQL